ARRVDRYQRQDGAAAVSVVDGVGVPRRVLPAAAHVHVALHALAVVEDAVAAERGLVEIPGGGHAVMRVARGRGAVAVGVVAPGIVGVGEQRRAAGRGGVGDVV